MDPKIEIEEQNPLSLTIASQKERELFSKDVTIKTNSDAVLLDDDCDMAIKTETKSGTHFPDFFSEKERECSTKTFYLLKQIKSETVTCCKINTKRETEEQALVSDFGSQNKREFLPEDPVVEIKKYNSNHEMDNKIEIKEEPWWLETETSSVCDEIKNEDFPPVKPSRLYIEAFSGDSSGKSPLPSAKVSGRGISFYNGKDCPGCECQESNVTKIPTVKEHFHSELSGNFSDGREINSGVLHLKQKNVIHENERPHKRKIPHKSFTRVYYLKRPEFIHRDERAHRCKVCDKNFTLLSHLKRHNLIHEGKKLHHCKNCDKNFTRMAHLKTHILIHEGKKTHQCKICNKRFTQLSDLKRHNLIHEGEKPHQCKTCNKSFTQLSSLKRHNLIHDGEKPHQCKICDKSFTQLSDLKRHNLIHEHEKPHQCKTCDKSFTRLSSLKRHNLIHEGEKPHQCKTCDKSFIRLSQLKIHNLIHEGKKPHQC